MKMTRSTSMTSMSGVTLMSFIPPMRRPLERPAAPLMPIAQIPPRRARGDVGGEAVQNVGELADAAREVVVRHDARDGGDEADGGRDERLGDLRRDDRKVRVLLISDAQERVHDPVHRAEETDERRGR